MIHWIFEDRIVNQDKMIKHINLHATDNYIPEDYLCFKFSTRGDIYVLVREAYQNVWLREDKTFRTHEDAFLYAGRLIDKAVEPED